MDSKAQVMKALGTHYNAGTLNASYVPNLDASKITKLEHSGLQNSNIFNQLLNTTNDAIFNSVLCNGSSGAFKVTNGSGGSSIALGYDFSNGYFTVYGRDMYLATDSGKKALVQETFDVAGTITTNAFTFNNSGNFLYALNNVDGQTPSLSYGCAIGWNASSGGGEMDFICNKDGGSPGGFNFYDWNGSTLTRLLKIDASGNMTVTGSLYGNSGTLTSANDFVAKGLINIDPSSGYPSLNLQYSSSNKMQLGYNGTAASVASCNIDLNLCTGSGGNLVLYPYGAVYLWAGRKLLPQNAGGGMVGDHTGNYFYEVAGYYMYGHTPGSFDAYDDLELVKQWGEPSPTITDKYDRTKQVPPINDPFSILKAKDADGNTNTDFYDYGNVGGFALSCAKMLALKQDEQANSLLNLFNEVEAHDQEIIQLKAKIEDLQSQLSALQNS